MVIAAWSGHCGAESELDPAVARLLAVEEAEARHVRWRRKTRGVLRQQLPPIAGRPPPPPLLGLPAIGEGEREGGEVTGERWRDVAKEGMEAK